MGSRGYDYSYQVVDRGSDSYIFQMTSQKIAGDAREVLRLESKLRSTNDNLRTFDDPLFEISRTLYAMINNDRK